jgi:mRNA-degrading endonuclease toxin of MazEF toxin-antitoxin module
VVGIGRESPPIGPTRGDIHLVAFPEIGGHVIRGPHPAVIVRTDRMRRSSTTLVVPMTSSPKSAEHNPPYLVAATARQSGLQRDGYVKCDQVATLPGALIGPRLGRLNPETLDRVDAALRFVLGL